MKTKVIPYHPELFTAADFYNLSLCVGWVMALSSGNAEDSIKRRETATQASMALVKVFGTAYHSRLRDLISQPPGDKT